MDKSIKRSVGFASFRWHIDKFYTPKLVRPVATSYLALNRVLARSLSRKSGHRAVNHRASLLGGPAPGKRQASLASAQWSFVCMRARLALQERASVSQIAIDSRGEAARTRPRALQGFASAQAHLHDAQAARVPQARATIGRVRNGRSQHFLLTALHLSHGKLSLGTEKYFKTFSLLPAGPRRVPGVPPRKLGPKKTGSESVLRHIGEWTSVAPEVFLPSPQRNWPTALALSGLVAQPRDCASREKTANF